ncbi:hypothetical protein SFB1_349G0 [Candidatus Arthromitus sp. SFB-1]|nr:hypothetical protein SFB1_349G0 [Candidatus Arthromitus sp. SFB-1]
MFSLFKYLKKYKFFDFTYIFLNFCTINDGIVIAYDNVKSCR